MAAVDDRPRHGGELTFTLEAEAWLVSLACRVAKELGYPHASSKGRCSTKSSMPSDSGFGFRGNLSLANRAFATTRRVSAVESLPVPRSFRLASRESWL